MKDSTSTSPSEMSLEELYRELGSVEYAITLYESNLQILKQSKQTLLHRIDEEFNLINSDSLLRPNQEEEEDGGLEKIRKIAEKYER